MFSEWLTSIRLRLRAITKREELERDLQEEMAFHLGMREEEHVAEGMRVEEARHAARREFGSEMRMREKSREMWSFAAVESFLQDARVGARSLVRRPGFAIVVTLILALGIGANTAVFGFLSTMFLQPLPVPEPDRLVRVFGSSADGGPNDVFSYPDYVDLRDRNRTFGGLAVSRHVEVNFATGEHPEDVRGELVSGNFFTMMGVPPVAGRALSPEDDLAPGSFARVVVSQGLAIRRFGGVAQAVGATVHLNGTPFTIVGVMPPAFRGTHPVEPADFWAPVMMFAQVRTGSARHQDIHNRDWGWLSATGRLKRGVTLAQASDDLARLSREIRKENPSDDSASTFVVHPARALPDDMQAAAGRALGFSLVLTGVLLLVACANIAAMLLAKSTHRAREVAIRQSLGAARWRLVRQWLTESFLTALPGGVAGLLVAVATARALVRFVPRQFGEVTPEVHLDARLLGFAFGATLVTGILTGLAPALAASRADLTGALKEGGLAAGTRQSGRARGVFVVAQTAACLVLLVVAGLLLRSLHNSVGFDPGFPTERLWLASVDAERAGYSEDRAAAFYAELRERVRALPGVENATLAASVPLGLGIDTTGVLIPGQTPDNGKPWFSIPYNVVGQDYFATMAIPLVSGRAFTPSETRIGAPPVAVVNETMARRFFTGDAPAAGAVGKSFRMAGPDGVAVEIVGVARDIAYFSPGERPRPYIYFNPTRPPDGAATLQVRARPGTTNLAAALQREAEALDPNVVVVDAMTFADSRAVTLFPERAMTIVATVFGILVLALTALGVYGLVAWSVARRTREIGIRLALGATPQSVLTLELRRGLKLTLIGLAIGVVGALAAAPLLGSQLFGLRALDPLTHATGALVLLAVSVAACWAPARRATRVPPTEALRYE